MGKFSKFFKKKRRRTKQVQTSQTAPWEPQAQQIQQIYEQAKTQSEKPVKFYPGNTYVDLAPDTEDAIKRIRARAQAGSPVRRDANAELQKTLRGEYLSGPAMTQRLEAAAREFTPTITSQFARSGRGRGGAIEVAKARALADAFSGLYGQERKNMVNAMRIAPVVASQDYEDLDRLSNIGARREDHRERVLHDLMNRHLFAQEEPAQRLARYSNLIQGNSWGGNTVNTQIAESLANSRFQNMLGGSAQGAAIGSRAGPWGAVAGGIAGGVLGATQKR
jgi:hypothetical protein